MKSIPVKVSGNIINELSEKVPSYMFAINEVLKNSYDACATKIEISYDLDNHVIQIHDNGHGMSESNLQSLFHIAKSSKTYGKIVCGNRYQQGEKGLGLLAVFKFGNRVKWQTTHQSYSGALSFEVCKNDLTYLDDISDFNIPIKSVEVNENFKGTLVKISCDQDDELDIIDKFFISDINTKKFTNLFLDSGVEVTFNLVGSKVEKFETNTTSLNDALNDSENLCLFSVYFNSNNGNLVTFKSGKYSTKINFNKKNSLKTSL
ncbi:ATP-binding protein [Psychrobacter sp. W2-37-MNA-CIBAN-0211]|uniref:ATP-binding protein n=1 Tax=Psychrobacter sp. W2-37-MNA-CIBAN-0211 TaxID=3140443 RepID=UPI003318D70F